MSRGKLEKLEAERRELAAARRDAQHEVLIAALKVADDLRGEDLRPWIRGYLESIETAAAAAEPCEACAKRVRVMGYGKCRDHERALARDHAERVRAELARAAGEELPEDAAPPLYEVVRLVLEKNSDLDAAKEDDREALVDKLVDAVMDHFDLVFVVQKIHVD